MLLLCLYAFGNDGEAQLMSQTNNALHNAAAALVFQIADQTAVDLDIVELVLPQKRDGRVSHGKIVHKKNDPQCLHFGKNSTHGV